MKNIDLMTTGAVALAGVALWYTFGRKPGGQVARQPAQAQRDAALGSWLDGIKAQTAEILGGGLQTDYGLTADLGRIKLGRPTRGT